MNHPLISICIPAYKRKEFVERVLRSIDIQTFKDYEIIISDDSPDDSVKNLVDDYRHLPIVYFKNAPSLGSPANWNFAISKAKGRWIKMMHDDDWFVNDESLASFVRTIVNHPRAMFVFSGFAECDERSRHPFVISSWQEWLLKRSPLYLFRKNYIGHPSTTLVRNTPDLFYDEKLKWVVDFEFYMRFLFKHRVFAAIRQPLINIGISEFQITKEAFRNPAIEIPEAIYLIKQLPKGSLKNIFVYDYYWRFLRNLSIRSVDDIKKHTDQGIPSIISKMIQDQSDWSISKLKKGILSKSLMLASYMSNYSSL